MSEDDRVAIIERWRSTYKMHPKVMRWYCLGWTYCKIAGQMTPIPDIGGDGWIEVVW